MKEQKVKIIKNLQTYAAAKLPSYYQDADDRLTSEGKDVSNITTQQEYINALDNIAIDELAKKYFIDNNPDAREIGFDINAGDLTVHDGRVEAAPFLTIGFAGIVAASLALREHYRTEASPCSINEKWDCGTVNKSSFAEIGGILDLILSWDPMQPNNNKGGFAWIRGIPVADVGIAGYLLLGVLAFMRWWRLLVVAAVPALVFSFYLAHIEPNRMTS